MIYAIAKCYKTREMLRTEGHRLLRETGKTQAEVVRAVHRSAPTVYRWFQGGKPDVDSANLLKDALGIPTEAWSQKPKRKSQAA